MGNVGDIERITQNRVVKLFKEKLGYTCLGNWGESWGRIKLINLFFLHTAKV